jgi:hypothetical protein
MTFTSRAPLLLTLPLLFFAAGALAAGVATRLAELIAPEPATLLEAAAVGQDEAIYRMVSAGEDPGLPVVLKRPLLRWKRGDAISPLLVAIALGKGRQVAFLAKHTERLAEAPNDLALCVAAHYGKIAAARFLMKRGAPAVPKNGCGEMERPEDIAKKYGSGRLSRELRQYRIETR